MKPHHIHIIATFIIVGFALVSGTFAVIALWLNREKHDQDP